MAFPNSPGSLKSDLLQFRVRFADELKTAEAGYTDATVREGYAVPM